MDLNHHIACMPVRVGTLVELWGIEPQFAVCQTAVFPLDESPIGCESWNCASSP